MAKYRLVRERLLHERLLSPDDLCLPDPIDWDDLRLVHDHAYVESVAAGTIPQQMQRRIGFPWSPMMVARARRSVGATLAAAREALHGLVAANLAGGTHHAFRDRGEGFC